MNTKKTKYAALKAPTILFILAISILSFKYERELERQRTTHDHLFKITNQLRKSNKELNYVLKMLGGSECAMRLKGVKSQIESLTLSLEEAYTDVAYCDDMDEKMMSLHMEILELENELGSL